MVELVDAPAYLGQLQALLPRGRAWVRNARALLTALLDAVAAGMNRLDRRAALLLLEATPSTATETLPEWERQLGLPDECSALGATIALRRAAVHHKATLQADSSAETYRRIARSFGAEIRAVEHDRAAAEAIPGLDTAAGRWRFVWWISIDTGADIRYFNTLSDVLAPLVEVDRITELECRLRKAAPAHTLLVLGYADLSAM